MRSMVAGQIPFFYVPGYGILRPVLGKDPVAGNKVDRHSKMEWMFAAGGISGAAYMGFNTMAAHKGLKMVSEATSAAANGANSLVNDIAVKRGVDDLHGLEKLKAYVPFTKANKAVTGAATFQNFDLLKSALQTDVDNLATIKAAMDPADLAKIDDAVMKTGAAGEALMQAVGTEGANIDAAKETYLAASQEMTGLIDSVAGGKELEAAQEAVAKNAPLRLSVQHLEDGVRSGKIAVSAPTGGIYWAPKTRGFGMRGAVMWRNADLFRWVNTKEGVAELQLSPTVWRSKAAAAIQAQAAYHLLTPEEKASTGLEARIAEVMATGAKGAATPGKAGENLLLGDAARAMSLGYDNAASKIYSFLRPGPLSDAIYAEGSNGATKLGVMKGLTNKFGEMGPLKKFGVAAGVGLALTGAMYLVQKKMAGGGQAPPAKEQAPTEGEAPAGQAPAEQPLS
jgi:hypothetical protein